MIKRWVIELNGVREKRFDFDCDCDKGYYSIAVVHAVGEGVLQLPCFMLLWTVSLAAN